MTVRLRLLIPTIAAILTGLPVNAQTSSPALATAELSSGFMLSDNNIDVRQPTDILAHLGLVYIGLNSILAGQADPDETLTAARAGHDHLFEVLSDATSQDTDISSRAVIALAIRFGKNPDHLEEILASLYRQAGLRGTSIKVERNADGGPAWGGFTTARDTLRLTISLMRSYPDFAQKLFGSNTDGRALWLSDGRGNCTAIEKGAQSERYIAVAVYGTPNPRMCDGAVTSVVLDDDARLEQVRPKHLAPAK